MSKLSLLLITLSALSGSCNAAYLAIDKALWYGAIYFPSSMTQVPPVRVYYAGNKIPCEIDKENNVVSFSISEFKGRNTFNLLVTEEVSFCSEGNTVTHLLVAKGRPYKLCRCTFKHQKDTTESPPSSTEDITKGTWEIQTVDLPDDQRIPDDAIIVCFHPDLITSIEGGDNLHLPKLVVNEQALDALTPEQLHDASIRCLLTSLNSDSVHAKTDAHYDIKNKTISLLVT